MKRRARRRLAAPECPVQLVLVWEADTGILEALASRFRSEHVEADLMVVEENSIAR